MEKFKLGYKVVKRKDGKFKSMVLGEVTYPLGEWAVPLPGWGPLTVLTSRKAARKVRKGFADGSCFVKRCLYVPSDSLKVWTLNSLRSWGSSTIEELEEENFWLMKGKTALADKVMIF